MNKPNQNQVPIGVEVGDVMSTCWGYGMTNREFFQVTRIAGKRMIEVRRIASKVVETTGYLAGKVLPVKDEFVHDTILGTDQPVRRACKNGWVRIDEVRRAQKCDPEKTAYFNHCD